MTTETVTSGPKPAPAPPSTTTELDLERYPGITAEEAKRRFKEDGPNELQHQKPRNIFAIVFGVIKEPMFLLLIACVALAFILGDFPEGGMLAADLSAPRAVVIRGGKQTTVPGREVVRGDLIMMKEGDRVPADLVVLWEMNLSADESLLTGESVPVRKSTGKETDELDAPGGEDMPYCFSGSMIVSGKGLGLVKATGVRTSLGKIGKSLAEIKQEKTPLEKETNRLVVVMAIIGCSVSLVVLLYMGFTFKPAVTFASNGTSSSSASRVAIVGSRLTGWLDGALTAITLAMGLLPEEFPVVLTVFLSLGAWRISKSDVLTRRNSAIETLGACTVLCTDKTGTLTMNQMMVQALWDAGTDHTFQFRNAADKEERVDEECHTIVEYAILSSQRDPFDPMEMALWRLSSTHQVDSDHVHLEWEMLKEYPLSKELLATSRVYRRNPQDGGGGGGGHRLIAAVKGAPEAVGDLCHLPGETFDRIRGIVNQLAGQGLRVLGVARCELAQRRAEAELPAIQHDMPFEFIGLVGFIDPIRPTVPAAIRQAYEAGVRVAMITGDYPLTAKSIAEKIGLEPRDRIITGPELDKMADDELRGRIRGTTIFARVVPEQKLRIVQAYKAIGEIVAMTGDGVNDAPALKAAHIGVAMGMRGTDVAREAAHLVLLDDDFSSIVRAVRLGRRIYDNLRKAMSYIIAIHIPLAGVILLPVLLGWGPIFHAVHIVFLEMVIDPACSVVLEAEEEEPGVMSRPPRDTRKSMVSVGTACVAVLQGTAILAAAMAVYHLSQSIPEVGFTAKQARAISFATVIVANLGLIVEDRSWELWFGKTLGRPNRAMWVVLCVVVPCLFLVLFAPYVIILFGFERMHPLGIPVFIGLGVAATIWFEAFKVIRNLFLRRRRRARELGKASQPESGKVEMTDLPSTSSVGRAPSVVIVEASN